MTPLLRSVVDLITQVQTETSGTRSNDLARTTAERLQAPLRVAVAGRVKAGKSTLINALLGERLAPTDAGECTKIITWYRHGLTYRVAVHDHQGVVTPAPFARPEGRLEIDTSHSIVPPDRITVEWPSRALEAMTLIDLPGVGSVNPQFGAKAQQFLHGEDNVSDADAVLYLMRHMHASDAKFLESFHELDRSRPGVLNAIGILSRADEIGVGQLGAMATATKIAHRYGADPRMRRLCQTVIPFAGLLAETAVTLRQDEFAALHRLTHSDENLDQTMLSVDRFRSATSSAALGSDERDRLLERFGAFGIRLSAALIQADAATSGPALAAQLADHSGLGQLRTMIDDQFRSRHELLRCRSALLALASIERQGDLSATTTRELERLLTSTHEFAEIRLLNELRHNRAGLTQAEALAAEQVLGASGTFAHQRLGADATTALADLATIALEERNRWNKIAEHPARTLEQRAAARVLIHSCEALAQACNPAS